VEQIGRVLNVPNRQLLVERRRVQRRGAGRIEDVGVARDRPFEDGRIRGHAAQAVFLDHPLQFAACDQAAADVVEPDRLAEDLHRSQRIRERGHLGEAPDVACLTRESRVQEDANQLARQFDADDAAADDEHVQVVVLHALVRRIRVVAEARPNPGDAVGGPSRPPRRSRTG
jgi:hypothetical protein